uniref:Holliday junction resolvase n=1 Tax=Moumouvirus sp. 'Monve' TaxID=1128131 RepID=H2EEP1_9VIRU|nr:hypothetical protein mv_L659 [Moumouvirus Monve]
MRIISWDVGVIHLAYCVLEYTYDNLKNIVTVNILDWDEINLIEDERINISCCGKMKNGNCCNKKATYHLNINDNTYGYCKTHLLQYNEIWSHKDTEKLFKKIDTSNKCNFIKNTGNCCDKKSAYIFKNKMEKKYFCTTHFKSELKKKLKNIHLNL